MLALHYGSDNTAACGVTRSRPGKRLRVTMNARDVDCRKCLATPSINNRKEMLETLDWGARFEAWKQNGG